MSNQEEKDYVIHAMRNAKGDDLERANIAFGDFTEKELDEPHGQSGRTRREVWQDYKDDRAKWYKAFHWLENAR